MNREADYKHPIQLIVQYYRCADPARQEEIDTCLRNNLLNSYLAAVHLLTEEPFDFSSFPNSNKIVQTVAGERLTYERAFKYANEVDQAGAFIWILSNADIYFDDSLGLVEWSNLDGVVYALTRYDVQVDGSIKLMDEQYAHGSQDAWMFRASENLEGMFTAFNLGIPGCDNRIVYEFVCLGYMVANPSLKIVARHLDLTHDIEISNRVEQYFKMTTPENIKSNKVAPPPYLGEIYPSRNLNILKSHDSKMHFQVIRDFADHVRYIDELRRQIAGLEHDVIWLAETKATEISKRDEEIRERDEQIRERDEQICERDNFIKHYKQIEVSLRNSVSWKITAPVRYFCDKILPVNSKRRLFAMLLVRMVKSPREFTSHINRSSIRSFLRYLHAIDPVLLEQLVSNTLSKENIEVVGGSETINEVLLNLVEGNTLQQPEIIRTDSVDIILPIYNAPELTAVCITSVLTNSVNCRLIIVNDASPDKRIESLLANVHGVPERNIEVIIHHNESNLGFVKTVNFAFSLTKGHFVILNSDTEVPPGWLDRIFAPIFAKPDLVASVTPFSNAGMACSFPEAYKDNPIFEGLSVVELDDFFRRYAPAYPIEIFTGVGFCMAFNRTAVNQIGFFDEENFGKGYGEEADWSLRAVNAGFINVLAPNLFVYHKHGGSFSAEEKNQLLSRNLDLFWKKHQCHAFKFQEFSKTDEPRLIREAMTLVIGARSSVRRQRVAILDVDMSGGGTVYSASLANELQKSGFDVIHFKYNFQKSFLKLRFVSRNLDITLIMPQKAAYELQRLLSFLGAQFILVNELFSWPEPQVIMEQLQSGALPYLVLAHDFFLVCPSWFLIDENGTFCDTPADQGKCSKCLKNNVVSGHRSVYGDGLEDIADWRESVQAFLLGSVSLVCFSPSTANYFAHLYPKLTNMVVLEHAIPNREVFVWKQRHFNGMPLNLGIIGNLFHIKGEQVINELITSPRFKDLQVHLTVFGQVFSPIKDIILRDRKITFTGGYKQEELPSLLEKHNISAIIVSSILPETFSYTTSEAILLGYPVICFNLGAQAERVNRYNCGIVINDISADGILSAIERILAAPRLVEEFSLNAANYTPATPEEHFGAIVSTISDTISGLRS